MKASKFTDAQKAFIVKQGGEVITVAEICRKSGISPATYFNWKCLTSDRLQTHLANLVKKLLQSEGCP